MNRIKQASYDDLRRSGVNHQPKPDRIFVRSFLPTIFVSCVLWILCPHPQDAHGAYDDALGFETAADLLNRGMYLEALGVYQEIADFSVKGEHRGQALLYSGTVYGLFLEQYDSALTQYEKVIRTYPDSLSAREAVFNSGTVSYEQGQFERAYRYFRAYLDDYPEGERRSTVEFWADSARGRTKEETAIPLPSPVLQVSGTTISVLIKDKPADVVLDSETHLKISGPKSDQDIPIRDNVARFSSDGHFLAVNGESIGVTRCRAASAGETIRVDGRRFRGSVTLAVEGKGLRVINHLPIEQYLYGVVPREMPSAWPREALMAQAVAARTYALYIRSKSKDKDYHVVATTASQVYGGYDSEVAASNEAVDLTRGQVITHDGKLIIAYFHSNSGGYTEDSSNVWSADLPYLKGIPDRYSQDTPGGNWDCVLTPDDLRDRLNRYGLHVGWVRKLETLGKSPAGRALKIRVITDSGDFVLKSNAFRIKVGATRLKSLLMDMEVQEDGLVLRGRGYGHGVGMSQWGARKMAQEGRDYQEILKHYYRNVDIVPISLN